jgi:hypothetical protein
VSLISKKANFWALNKEQPTYAPIFIGEYELRRVQGGERMPAFHPLISSGGKTQLFSYLENKEPE